MITILRCPRVAACADALARHQRLVAAALAALPPSLSERDAAALCRALDASAVDIAAACRVTT